MKKARLGLVMLVVFNLLASIIDRGYTNAQRYVADIEPRIAVAMGDMTAYKKPLLIWNVAEKPWCIYN